MALQTLQIFKHLPKTNCKDCGFPTCLAFAMQLAIQKVKLDQCPHISEEGKAALSSQSRPAIKLIKVAGKEIGNETVIFRHEKTFYHETLLAYEVKDSEDIDKFKNTRFQRVGQELSPDLVYIKFKEKEKFVKEVNKTLSENIGMILECDELDIIKELAAKLKEKVILKPSKNHEDFAKIAKEHNLIIAIGGNTLEEISQNVEKILKITDNMIIEVNLGNFRKNIETLTKIRQIAVKHKFQNLGFPTLVRAKNTIEAATYLTRYASIVVIDKLDQGELFPLLTLRQNIYTDPQKPLQVDPGIYEIGKVTKDSPVLVTTNFSLTYFTVSSEIGSSKIPANLLVVDTEGMSVLTGFAADKFTPDTIKKAMINFKLEDKVDEKKIIIPGLVAQMSGTLEEESNWKVIVGPREAKKIQKFMAALK